MWWFIPGIIEFPVGARFIAPIDCHPPSITILPIAPIDCHPANVVFDGIVFGDDVLGGGVGMSAMNRAPTGVSDVEFWFSVGVVALMCVAGGFPRPLLCSLLFYAELFLGFVQ